MANAKMTPMHINVKSIPPLLNLLDISRSRIFSHFNHVSTSSLSSQDFSPNSSFSKVVVVDVVAVVVVVIAVVVLAVVVADCRLFWILINFFIESSSEFMESSSELVFQ